MSNKKFFWLKLKEDFFEEDTLQWLEEQENGTAYCLFYLKLCLKSLKSNGVLIRNVGQMLVPYDAKKLSEITRTDIDTVRVAMGVFEKIGLVQILDNGEIYLTQLEYMVGSETKWAEKKRLQRQKKDNVPIIEGQSPIEIEIENRDKEIEIKDRDKENISKDILCSTYVQRLIKKWNSIGLSSTLKTINVGTNRYKMLKARIKQYSEEEILNAIDEIPKSDFLMGRIKEFEITFDWFIKPNNFSKVLEGNYRNKGGKPNVQGANGVRSTQQDSGSIADKFKERQHRLTDEERRRAEEELD